MKLEVGGQCVWAGGVGLGGNNILHRVFGAVRFNPVWLSPKE